MRMEGGCKTDTITIVNLTIFIHDFTARSVPNGQTGRLSYLKNNKVTRDVHDVMANMNVNAMVCNTIGM